LNNGFRYIKELLLHHNNFYMNKTGSSCRRTEWMCTQ